MKKISAFKTAPTAFTKDMDRFFFKEFLGVELPTQDIQLVPTDGHSVQNPGQVMVYERVLEFFDDSDTDLN